MMMMAAAAATPAAGASVFVDLATASAFGLLGGTISNTGTSVVTGDVGVGSVSGTITGFNPTGTTVGGSVFTPGDTLSNNAYSDFLAALSAAQLLAPTQTYSDLTLDRTFIGNNVYAFSLTDISTTSGITLTFDAENNPDEYFVVRTDGSLTVNGALNFILQGQARADHIFWIVGTAATISVGSSGPIDFDGNILAGSSFTMSAAAGGSGELAGVINGCAFSVTANTLAGTTNVGGCSGSGVASVPEPAFSGVVGLVLVMGLIALRRYRLRRAGLVAAR